MFIKKLKIEPSCTLLCIYPQGPLKTPQRYVCLDAYCCTDHSSQETEATWIPINRWVCKENVGLNTIEFYGRMKKNEMLTFAKTWMKLEIIILSKINWTWNNKRHLFPHVGTLHFNLCVVQIMHMNSSPCVCRSWKYKGGYTTAPCFLVNKSLWMNEKKGGERKKGAMNKRRNSKGWGRERKRHVRWKQKGSRPIFSDWRCLLYFVVVPGGSPMFSIWSSSLAFRFLMICELHETAYISVSLFELKYVHTHSYIYFVSFFFFFGSVSLTGLAGTNRDFPASTTGELGLKACACAVMPGPMFHRGLSHFPLWYKHSHCATPVSRQFCFSWNCPCHHCRKDSLDPRGSCFQFQPQLVA